MVKSISHSPISADGKHENQIYGIFIKFGEMFLLNQQTAASVLFFIPVFECLPVCIFGADQKQKKKDHFFHLVDNKNIEFV